MIGSKTGTKKSQKHKNKQAYKLRFKQDKVDLRENTKLDRVCERCYEQLKWKLQFGKYKPLNTPAKCQKCEKKKIVKPYRIICNTCADQLKCCAKCGQDKEIHLDAKHVTSKTAEMRRLQEFDRYVGMMQERSRRKIHRLLEDGLVAFEGGKFTNKKTGEEITPIYYQKKYWDELGITGGLGDDADGD